MDNFLDLFKSLSNLGKESNENKEIPKEIKDQYPYGEFPIQYTKSGQERIRKQSENRFSYSEEHKETNKSDNSFNFDQLGLLLPLIQTLSGEKKQPKDLLKIFGKLLFKDNPEMEKIFSLLPKITSQEVKQNNNFPNTNVVNISSLKRID